MQRSALILVACLLLTLTLMSASAQQSDPNAGLVPDTQIDGPALEFDFPGMLIGTAEYAEGPTGTTVFYFPERVMAAVDVRGGAPGTINTDLLRLGYETRYTNAIALSGGSAYGLGAATGVAQEIKTLLDDPGWWTSIPVVSGAIIFDLGGRRYNAVTPDERLGRAAIRAGRPGFFPLGAQGAGRFAMQGGYYKARQHSGQGAAFAQYGDVRIAAFTVVNSFGGVVGRDGRFVRCDIPVSSDCPDASSVLRASAEDKSNAEDPQRGLTSNTTISLVVTNQKLSFAELQRFAMQVHTSMGRAIQPFHTINDGDTLFAITTADVESGGMSIEQLGVQASELMWDAVLSSVPEISPPAVADDTASTVNDMLKYTGTYEFAPGMQATVSMRAGRLLILAPDRDSMYLPAGSTTTLIPVSGDDFVLQTQRADVLRFEVDSSRDDGGDHSADEGVDRGAAVTGLVINPGRWPVKAVRTEKVPASSPG